MSTAAMLSHPTRFPKQVKVQRVFLRCDFRCRDEGFKEWAISRISESKRTNGRLMGMGGATEWWAKHITETPGAFVLFVNRSRHLMALVGDGMYAQARFERPVDLSALQTAFAEAWGLKLDVSKTIEEKYAKAVEDRGGREGEDWWPL